MSARIFLDVEDFKDILQTLEEPIKKHETHDQSTHGSWASGNKTGIHEAGIPLQTSTKRYVDYPFSDDFYTQLTEQEIQAVSDYQLTGYMKINQFLRNLSSESVLVSAYIEKTAKFIDSAIDKAPEVMPDNSAVFRVVDKTFIEGLEEGSVLTDKGYTSTTMRDLSNMKNSEYKKFEDIGRTIVRIDLGKNKKGLAINTIHKNTNRVDLDILMEKEFLLPRNTQFEYKGYDEKNKVYVLKRLT